MLSMTFFDIEIYCNLGAPSRVFHSQLLERDNGLKKIGGLSYKVLIRVLRALLTFRL